MGAISFSGSGESPRSLTTTGNSTEASFPPSDNVIQGDLPSAGPSRAGPDLSLAWSAQSDHTLAAGRCAPAPELLRGRCTRTSKTWSDGAREIPSHRSPECPLASARSIRPRSLRSLRAPPSLLRRPSVRPSAALPPSPLAAMLGDPPARAGQHEAAETSEGANCALLVHRDGDSGKCGLFQKGRVPVVADCTSWIEKVET